MTAEESSNASEESSVLPEENNTPSAEGSQMSQRQVWLLVIGLVVLSAVLFGLDFNPESAINRKIEPVAGFQPLGLLSDVTIEYPPGLGENTAVFIGTLSPDENSQLTAIDITTDDVRWQVTGADQIRPDLWPEAWAWAWPFAWQWGPMITIGDQVVVADAFGLATTVSSFDITNGAPGWQRSIGLINGSDVNYLTVADELVVARVAVEGYSEFQMIDPETGFRRFQRQQDVGQFFGVELEPRRVFEAFSNQVRVTGERPWQQAVSGCDAVPFLTADLVILQTGPCSEEENRGQPGVFALARSDGVLQWQLNQPVVSNLAIDGDHIVGLTLDANLLVLDVTSGAVQDTLPFAPALDFTNGAHFFVAARDDIFAVYFGDSRELVVVRWEG